MNKILIVGHPTSGYAEVESLLQACGMAAPLLSASLAKAHGVPALLQASLSGGSTTAHTEPCVAWDGARPDAGKHRPASMGMVGPAGDSLARGEERKELLKAQAKLSCGNISLTTNLQRAHEETER